MNKSSSNKSAQKLLFNLLLLLIATPILSHAQRYDRNTINYLNYANKPFYFGITLGNNLSQYRINRSETLTKNNRILGISSSQGFGLHVNIISNMKLGSDFDLRFLPGLVFPTRSIDYSTVSQPKLRKRIPSTYIELPFLLRYKSKPYKDARLFVVAGIKYSHDLQSNARVRTSENLIRIAPSEFLVEYGAGIQFFLPYVILSPEFKVSQGINNILINQDFAFSNVIDRLFSSVFSISIHIEG